MPCPNNAQHGVRYEYAPNDGPLQIFCPTCLQFWDACPVTAGTTACALVKGHDPPHINASRDMVWTINATGITRRFVVKE